MLNTSTKDSTDLQIGILKHSPSEWYIRQARGFAKGFGFNKQRLAELEIVVGELVTNTLKYAGSGTIVIKRETKPRPGIEICVSDVGPGITDIDTAMIDGYSKDQNSSFPHGFSLGVGLGSVKRLFDWMAIENTSKGLKVIARKWVVRES